MKTGWGEESSVRTDTGLITVQYSTVQEGFQADGKGGGQATDWTTQRIKKKTTRGEGRGEDVLGHGCAPWQKKIETKIYIKLKENFPKKKRHEIKKKSERLGCWSVVWFVFPQTCKTKRKKGELEKKEVEIYTWEEARRTISRMLCKRHRKSLYCRHTQPLWGNKKRSLVLPSWEKKEREMDGWMNGLGGLDEWTSLPLSSVYLFIFFLLNWGK